MIQKPAGLKLGKNARRDRLREFRYALVDALIQAQFEIPKEAVKVFFEGRFMKITAKFDGGENMTYLKPHIAVECFLGDIKLQPNMREVTTLIKLTLGKECEHISFPVICVALDETAAEKWVALTRRVANSAIRFRQSDKHLVRHIYDLFNLKTKEYLTGEYILLIDVIMEKDRTQFNKYNADYTENPMAVSESALAILNNDPQWKDHWNYFLTQMVYDEHKPEFNVAYLELQKFSQPIFNTQLA